MTGDKNPISMKYIAHIINPSDFIRLLHYECRGSIALSRREN